MSRSVRCTPTSYLENKGNRVLSGETSFLYSKKDILDFPSSTVDESLPANVGTWVSSLVREDSTCLGTTEGKL